jgi:hypothetical protein
MEVSLRWRLETVVAWSMVEKAPKTAPKVAVFQGFSAEELLVSDSIFAKLD